jgi:hypothetical protein
MMGVPAEVMKLVAALAHVEAIEVLPKFAERRSTRTIVRASGFERSRDNRTEYANRSAGASIEIPGGRKFSRIDFACDPEGNVYVCPGGKELKEYNRVLQAARRPDEGRHAPLLREKARPRRLRGPSGAKVRAKAITPSRARNSNHGPLATFLKPREGPAMRLVSTGG